MTERRPVLLVHGFASSFERNWREPGWVDLLAESGRTVIELDLPGHGGAGAKPHDPAAYADMADAVSAAVPEGITVDAVGFSMGAALVLEVAAAEPGRFGRIVVAGVGESLFRAEDPEPAARAVESGRATDDDPPAARAFATFSRAAGNDPAALAACLRRPRHPFGAAHLATLTRPVLVVLGSRDFAGPAEPLVDALPDARLVTLPGVDHFATPKDYRFIEAALGFIDQD
jgi:pimeloyl-ACP methyl ester carboxylesterase